MSTDGIGLILKAAQFAAHKNKDQRRKDASASPYINHPLALASTLREEGQVEDAIVLAAALLHDTIEETETDYEELRGQFGDEVAEIVAEVTDTKWLQKASRKRIQGTFSLGRQGKEHWLTSSLRCCLRCATSITRS